MKAFTFAEICLSKKCFRVVRVIARDEGQARRMIYGGDWGWAFLGEQATNGRKRSAKTRLIRTRGEWGEFVGHFGLTADSAEKRISAATKMPTSST